MSIARELSCDVATAMLTPREGEQAETRGGELTEIVLEVHTTLRRLTNASRRSRLNTQFFPEQSKSAGVGNTSSDDR
jgi:hypothetical protein